MEHRLHRMSLPVVCRIAWGYCLLGQTIAGGRIAKGGNRWELCSMRPVCPSIGDGISLYLSGCRNQFL